MPNPYTAQQWAQTLGYGLQDVRAIDWNNPTEGSYDYIQDTFRPGTVDPYEAMKGNYESLPDWQKYMTTKSVQVDRGSQQVFEDQQVFDWDAWRAANPNAQFMRGNFGGSEGEAYWIQDASGNVIGAPTAWGNPDRDYMRRAALVIAGGYFGGNALAEAYGGAAAGAAEGGAAAGAGGKTSAEVAALYGDAGYGAGMTGAETASYDAALEAAATSGGTTTYNGFEDVPTSSSTTNTGGSEFNPEGFNGREPTNPSFVQNGNGYSGYNASGAPTSTTTQSGVNWDALIRGGTGLYQAYRLNQMGNGSSSGQAANEELTRLLNDPNAILNYPGYRASVTALERQGAGGGYLGSGNMMAALQQHTGEFYDRALQRLAGITTPELAVNQRYNMAAISMLGQAMNTLGYGNAQGSYYDALVKLLSSDGE